MSSLATFPDRLLAWWDIHGRKDLPWQHPRTPYRVWVSEIMLQQTQVTTVIPYFEKFLARFPVLSALAGASQDDVLAQWSGLGYYARARNLHNAAQICVRDHHGHLPISGDELVNLPGIGRSTANAITSQTQDVPATVMDGNVKRVMARHAAIDGWAGVSKVLKELLKAADERLATERGADYTQAIMDLGATLCTRSKPRCTDCPVSEDCLALSQGRVDQLPASKPKAGIKTQTLFMLIIRRPDGSVLLQRRPPAGIWGGLWSLPEGTDAQQLKKQFGVKRASEKAVLEHRLSHRLMKIHPLVARQMPAGIAVRDDGESGWYGRERWKELGIPKPVMDILEQLESES